MDDYTFSQSDIDEFKTNLTNFINSISNIFNKSIENISTQMKEHWQSNNSSIWATNLQEKINELLKEFDSFFGTNPSSLQSKYKNNIERYSQVTGNNYSYDSLIDAQIIIKEINKETKFQDNTSGIKQGTQNIINELNMMKDNINEAYETYINQTNSNRAFSNEIEKSALINVLNQEKNIFLVKINEILEDAKNKIKEETNNIEEASSINIRSLETN